MYTNEYFDEIASFDNDPEVLADFMRLAGLPINVPELISLAGSCHFSLRTLLATNFTALEQQAELGQRGAALLKFLQVLILRFQRSKLANRDVISNITDLYHYLTMRLSALSEEQVILLLLDAKNQLISDAKLAAGTSNKVVVYPSQIIRRALEKNASAVIIVHNHPSGDTTPSEDDIETSIELDLLCNRLNITFHDHIIVGRDSVVSLRSSGFLSPRALPGRSVRAESRGS